jgi:3' exoribonuclease, RNase T-like
VTRYFVDTEFIEDGRTIDLLSLGIVAEDGRQGYWQSLDCDLRRANEWIKANVLPHLVYGTGRTPWFSRAEIARELRDFVSPEQYGRPEFWGYYADYDWVAVCQLFGTMMDLPTGWPMYCRDIKQWADDLGNPQLPEQGKGEHHALADAQWNRKAWQFLNQFSGERLG